MTAPAISAPTDAPVAGQLLGYARVSTGHQSLDQQVDALVTAGVDRDRVYDDVLTGTSTKEQRPGLMALIESPQGCSLKFPACGLGQCSGCRVPVVALRRASPAAW